MQPCFSCPWLSYTAPHDDLSTSRASPNSLHLITFGVTQLVMVLWETLKFNTKSVLLAYPSLLWRKGIKETNLCHIFSFPFWSGRFLGSITSRCSGNEPALLLRKVSSRVWPERAAKSRLSVLRSCLDKRKSSSARKISQGRLKKTSKTQNIA